jgi:hypothetical protein
MSRNGSGTYNLPAGNPVVSGSTITSSWANTTLTDIANALTGSLASDGQTPASGDLNMGSNQIKDMADPTLDQDATTKAWVNAAITTAVSPPFPANTLMLFVQTAAPSGWTKVTTHNNKALRIVSGAAGTGGSVDFTTAFASQAVTGTVSTSISAISATIGAIGATTLTTAQMPSHNHTEQVYFAGGGTSVSVAYYGDSDGSQQGSVNTTGYTGGGNSHTHSSPSFTFNSGTVTSSFTGTSINLAVSYVDVIIAIKN